MSPHFLAQQLCHLLEKSMYKHLRPNLPVQASFVCLLHNMVETTFHPAQKYPVIDHSHLDASSSQIPAPEKEVVM
jgi:hypothetical protein